MKTGEEKKTRAKVRSEQQTLSGGASRVEERCSVSPGRSRGSHLLRNSESPRERSRIAMSLSGGVADGHGWGHSDKTRGGSEHTSRIYI